MANTLSVLTPTLISDTSVMYLRKNPGLLGRVRVETIQENELNGGNVVNIPLPNTIFTPQARSYTSPPAAQDITLTSKTLTINQQYEVKISLNELEQKLARGGINRVLAETIPSMIDGLVTKIDSDLFALYTDYTQTVGTYNGVLTDIVFREGIQKLMDSNVNFSNPGNVHLVLDPKAYIADLFAEDRYTLALNIGDNGKALATGQAPLLYNVDVSQSPNVPVTTISGGTSAHNLLFEKDAFCIGFIQFNPAKRFGESAPVDENIIVDPVSRLSMRWSKFYDADKSTWFLRLDAAYGVVTLDPSRFVRVLSKVT